MTAFFSNDRWVYVGTIDTSGANTTAWMPGNPVTLKRLVFIVTTAMTVADATLTIGSRVADLATPSTTYATVVLPYLTGIDGAQLVVEFTAPTAVVASLVYPDQTGRTAPVVYTAPGLLEIDLGEELFITSDGGGNAGVLAIYAEYIAQGLNNVDHPTADKLTATLA